MTENKVIENWLISQVINGSDESWPVIAGFIDGKFVQPALLLWFDLDKKIAMTDKHIYSVGKPNQPWVTTYLANGNCIDNHEIKDIVH